MSKKSNGCERCGEPVGSEVCHLNIITMEVEEDTNLFRDCSVWLCMDCWRKLVDWIWREDA